MSAPSRVALRLFNYPAWHVLVNGRIVQTGTREGTGQMLVPVERGLNRVEVGFTRTWDRTLGISVSFVTMFLVMALRPCPMAIIPTAAGVMKSAMRKVL